MHPAFSWPTYTLKRQGLSIAGKYRLFNPHNEVVLYIEEKTKLLALSKTITFYADEKKTQPVLMVQLTQDDLQADYAVIDAAGGGQKIGAVDYTVENLADFIKDKWNVMDAAGAIVAVMFERSAGRALLRELTENAVPQKLEIHFGEALVGEIKQKVTMLGYQATLDFSMDTGSLLDRRLGIAAALVAAVHQAEQE